MSRALLLVACLASTAAAPAMAQAADEETEIVVTGQRERGAVTGDIKPELQLRPADVRALGVSNITELLTELAPQLRTGGGDGQPVVLLEGRRISGFREIATIPSEAIARVDILPGEVALKYGFPLGQKVVNIVLRQRFRAVTVELEDRMATGGRGNAIEGDIDFLRLQRGSRFSINIERETRDRLLETQRGIDDGTGSAQFRTLLPATQLFTAGATLSRTIFGDVSATLNGELQTEDSQATSGFLAPLERSNGSVSARAGTTLNGTLADWRWTFTGTYDHVETKSLIARDALLDVDQARSTSDIAALDFILNGSPLRLPAGEVSTTFKAGASFSRFSASAVRNSIPLDSRVARDVADAQVSIDVPLTSRREDVLAAIGDLSVNGNFAARRLSDFGTLQTLGYGVTWSPVRALSLIGSVTENSVAPTAQQLGNPVIETTGVRVFDFVRGETAFVTQTSGGNRGLVPSDQSVIKLAATLKPFDEPDITFTGEYQRTRTRQGIASLPPASLAAQTAFPDRYQRDGSGALVGVDSRTVNFARADASQVRWGINFSKPLKTSQAQVDALRAAFREARPRGARPPGGGSERAGRGSGGGFGGGGQGGGGGRLNLAVYHTVRLTDSVVLRDGLPTIDPLRGGSIGNGGQPRHEIEVQAGIAKNGLGARLTSNWASATRVNGALPADDLRFSSLGTANLRLFANLGQLPGVIKRYPWLAGTRVTLGVTNILDSRQRVTDASGITPINYSPGYLDPLGRTIRISIRKLLF